MCYRCATVALPSNCRRSKRQAAGVNDCVALCPPQELMRVTSCCLESTSRASAELAAVLEMVLEAYCRVPKCQNCCAGGDLAQNRRFPPRTAVLQPQVLLMALFDDLLRLGDARVVKEADFAVNAVVGPFLLLDGPRADRKLTQRRRRAQAAQQARRARCESRCKARPRSSPARMTSRPGRTSSGELRSPRQSCRGCKKRDA